MGIQSRIDTLSQLTEHFLVDGESEQVDFKRNPDGISPEDLIAFANVPNGGTILAGIDEKTIDKKQVGVVHGCDVSDNAVLQILNKAMSCIPPVSVNIYAENLAGEPILRIEIPPSPTRPHCTTKGIYCRRDGARNRPLHPSELLSIFLEKEARVFSERFDEAARHISEELSLLESSLNDSIENMSNQLGWADSKLGDTDSSLNSILAYVRSQANETDDLTLRLRAIFRQDKRDDPIRSREHAKLVKELASQLRPRPDLIKGLLDGKKMSLNLWPKAAAELSQEDINQAFVDAIKVMQAEDADSKFAIIVKEPSECDNVELDAYDEIAAHGGEVTSHTRRQVNSAVALGFIKVGSETVGTAALRPALKTVRAKLFKLAGASVHPDDYDWELAWITLRPEHRNIGQMTRLLKLLLPKVGDEQLFSVADADDELALSVLREWGFVLEGAPFTAPRDPNQQVQLFALTSQS